jgi:hypothetical protein
MAAQETQWPQLLVSDSNMPLYTDKFKGQHLSRPEWVTRCHCCVHTRCSVHYFSSEYCYGPSSFISSHTFASGAFVHVSEGESMLLIGMIQRLASRVERCIPARLGCSKQDSLICIRYEKEPLYEFSAGAVE